MCFSNGLFFFENRDGVCIQIKQREFARYDNVFAQSVAVMRLHFSKKNNPLHINLFYNAYLILFNHYYCLIVYMRRN